MANNHRFKVKNGVTTPNIEFKDSNAGSAITATMVDSTDTLSFEGNAGQLFSITDALTGTLFAVSDISGIPSLEINDQGIVKLAEFNGKVLIGTTDSGSTDSDVLNVGGTVKASLFSGSGASLTALNGSTISTGTIDSARLPLGTFSAGGGGGTPGGSNTQVQFNDGGAFAGNAGMTFNKTTGVFTATAKSFDIEHPTKESMRLRYGSLEGPENGVYVRGRLKGRHVIDLPDYWTGLVDKESITVSLTPVGNHQGLYVESIENNMVFVSGENNSSIDCFYVVYGERKDVDKITVEYSK